MSTAFFSIDSPVTCGTGRSRSHPKSAFEWGAPPTEKTLSDLLRRCQIPYHYRVSRDLSSPVTHSIGCFCATGPAAVAGKDAPSFGCCGRRCRGGREPSGRVPLPKYGLAGQRVLAISVFGLFVAASTTSLTLKLLQLAIGIVALIGIPRS